MNEETTEILKFKITGPQSIERIEPLLSDLFPYNANNSSSALHFVWETTCTKDDRESHKNAQIINKLHNTQVVESKSCFAFLQLNMDVPSLKTYVANNSSEAGVWFHNHWGASSTLKVEQEEKDWWAVKASNGNGGKDIWIVNKNNFNKVEAELPVGDKYVIQRYVHRPLLHKGKKFHFRCYSVLRADMSALLYRNAFILAAGLPFDYADDDQRKHVTNLSVNKHFEGHEGQIPCDLVTQYPQLFVKIKAIWRSVVDAASPFMRAQSSANHFEFFGLDVIADESGECWLIESNRLPGLESSNNNKAQEDIFYDDMMRSLLRIVLRPLCQTRNAQSVDSPVTAPPSVFNNVDSLVVPCPADSETALNDEFSELRGGWEFVKGRSETWEQDCRASPEMLSLNLLNWVAFTRKHRQSVSATANA